MKYQIVYCDPPWNEQGAGQCKRGADRHYPLMKTEDIIEYLKKIPFDDNCLIYMWVTSSFLPDGLLVLNSLNFKYITNAVWIKDRIGLGHYFRHQHELLLVGRKGNISLPPTDIIHSSVFESKKREHSRKPDAIRTMLNEQYPDLNKVEVFARQKFEGWGVWGNEIPTTTQQLIDV